jgi:hypothetical protein
MTNDQRKLRDLIREEFHPKVDVRFNKTCITITILGDIAFQVGFTVYTLANAAEFFVRSNELNYTVNCKDPNRFKLIPIYATLGGESPYDRDDRDDRDDIEDIDFEYIDDDTDFDAEFDKLVAEVDAEATQEEIDQVVSELRDVIFETVEDAHFTDHPEAGGGVPNDQPYDRQQLEDLQILKLDYQVEEFLTANLSAVLEITKGQTIDVEVLKNVMKFAYLGGMWENARAADLEMLAEYFNSKFKFHAEQYGEG